MRLPVPLCVTTSRVAKCVYPHLLLCCDLVILQACFNSACAGEGCADPAPSSDCSRGRGKRGELLRSFCGSSTLPCQVMSAQPPSLVARSFVIVQVDTHVVNHSSIQQLSNRRVRPSLQLRQQSVTVGSRIDLYRPKTLRQEQNCCEVTT